MILLAWLFKRKLETLSPQSLKPGIIKPLNKVWLQELQALEQAEVQAWVIANKWDSSIQVAEVTYNRQFDVQALQNLVSSLIELSTVNTGPEYSREIALTALSLLDKLKKIPADRKAAIEKEIKEAELITPTPELSLTEQS